MFRESRHKFIKFKIYKKKIANIEREFEFNF